MPAKKSKRSKNKKKGASSMEPPPPTPAGKQVLFVPKRDSSEYFPELHLELNDVRLIDARKFSLAVAHSNATQWREFMRIGLPSERYAKREYNYGTGPTTGCLLSKSGPKGPWMMYRMSTRADELTTLDYKESKLYYLQYMPQALITDEKDLSLQYITDWLSIAYIMRNELERRRQGVESFGRGKRLTMTNMKITPIHHTHRKALAKEEKKNFKIWPLMIGEAANDIDKSIRNRILYFENILRFGGVRDNFKEFQKRNKNWMDERLKCANMHMQIVSSRKPIEALNKMRPFNSVYHMVSELHEVAPGLGHSVFLCRALKDLDLGIEKQEIVRKIHNNGMIPLRVRPTRYQYGPGAVAVYNESSKFMEPLPLEFHSSPLRAPSVNSLSGFSSESAASTATESPGDWHHNWKMQTMHRDMEHRLMDTSIQNPLEEQQLGELEMSQRIANEVDRRIAMINDHQRFENTIAAKDSSASRLFQFFVDSNEVKLRRDVKVVKELKKQLTNLGKLSESIENDDALKLQVADYVFNEMLRMMPGNEKDPYEGLGINNAWKTMIDNHAITTESIDILKTMISSHHSWVNVNCTSQKCVIPRCDQLQHEGITSAEFSAVSIPWMLLPAGICLVCAVLIGFMVTT
ncbi:hypothetical protein Y032_0045g1243 [Ancylostoma ceylanicum]|uniref:Uncharacterized protein n=1 Tax=Ancylostoma ceylanicum TaxID=53326 RepID=A0A016UCP4_9BILA|nr:hypothetical protein Y032_0045g1243 [Ancylostoma ceylanicum]